MNWSKKWPSEAAKVFEDAVRFGTGLLQDGKHIPIEKILSVEIKTIEFMHGNKQYHANVTIVGDLALEYDDNGWNIFHVPTLTLFSKAIPGYIPVDSINNLNMITNEYENKECYEYEKDQLLNWMKKVQENYPTSWTMLRCLTPEDYEDKGKSAKDIILKWCLSVKVE